MSILRVAKNQLRDSAVHRWIQRRRDMKVLHVWDGAGRPPPPPQAFKKDLIRKFSRLYGTRVFVETGTNFGDTVASALGNFDMIYSIELFDKLYLMAARRFVRFTNVKLRRGDSAVELPLILEELHEPTLFWLDAHYSGTGTARGDIDTPIAQELQAISEHPVRGHVILIDDARLFDGTNSYPTIETCRSLAARFRPQDDFWVEDDVIRIAPRSTDAL